MCNKLRNSSPPKLQHQVEHWTSFKMLIESISLLSFVNNLLYLDSGNSYLYKEELDSFAKISFVNITYLDSRDQLHKEINLSTYIRKG